MRETAPAPMTAFTPGFPVADPLANHWLRQAVVRLRRELCWLWREHALVAGGESGAGLPAVRDKLSTALDLQRFWEQKQEFFRTDPTAAYLSGLLRQESPGLLPHPRQGSFSWAAQALGLGPVDCFLLALGLVAALDHAAGPVLAACQNDASRHHATLSLAQRLWDEPEAVLAAADPDHALHRVGLLPLHDGRWDWEHPLTVAPTVARVLLNGPMEPAKVREPLPPATALAGPAAYIAARLQADREQAMQLVPLPGARDAGALALAASISIQRQRRLATVPGGVSLLSSAGYLNTLATACWLRGEDLFLDHDQVKFLVNDRPALEPNQLPSLTIPITLYLAVEDRKQLGRLPERRLFPAADVPKPGYRERLSLWKKHLDGRAPEPLLAECSRRFRFTGAAIERVAEGLQARPGTLDAAALFAACRSELHMDFGDLAQPLSPRFRAEELILPPKAQGRFREILHAMRSLTEVHYAWGTERVWNEAGVAVLFAGPSGTGKTMAAEILAERLDLPMYRVDLSQVVSKYIGETEKHLKRVFDAGETSDAILFFDEADALFGKRSEVKDSHDRYANLEISYLLERMERFKGLAILATNRKKDLDEAFLRRLRYTLDFPLPGPEERKRIWCQVIPEHADAGDVDFDFLAHQFSLAGGHIRSIVFNACLQSAGQGQSRRLTTEKILVALKWEFEKLHRALNREQFGPYMATWDQAEAGHA